jgi:hypothetical protein
MGVVIISRSRRQPCEHDQRRQAQHPKGLTLMPAPIPGDRDWDLSGLPRQSPRKLETISPASGNRICAGLRGGAGRTQACKQAIISLKVMVSAAAVGQDCGPIEMALPRKTVAPCGPLPSMIAANVRGGMKANVPFHLAFTRRDLGERRTQSDATSSIQERALASRSCCHRSLARQRGRTHGMGRSRAAHGGQPAPRVVPCAGCRR